MCSRSETPPHRFTRIRLLLSHFLALILSGRAKPNEQGEVERLVTILEVMVQTFIHQFRYSKLWVPKIHLGTCAIAQSYTLKISDAKPL